MLNTVREEDADLLTVDAMLNDLEKAPRSIRALVFSLANQTVLSELGSEKAMEIDPKEGQAATVLSLEAVLNAAVMFANIAALKFGRGGTYESSD
jgi:hypothetical protein